MKKKKLFKSLKLQIIVTISLLVLLAGGMLALVLSSSSKLNSSLSDVWQEMLDTRAGEMKDMIFEKNPYIEPDRLYLAKLEPAFWGLSEQTAITPYAEQEGWEDAYFSLAITNICANIKKGISYTSSLRSCYWVLDDENAPMILVNGTPVFKKDLIDTEWLENCSQEEKLQLSWRNMPLSYLYTTPVLTIYRRVVSQRNLGEGVIQGTLVLNYDLSNKLNSFTAKIQNSEKVYFVDIAQDKNVSAGSLLVDDDLEKELLQMAKTPLSDAVTNGMLHGKEGDRLYYRVEELCEGIHMVVCHHDQTVSRAMTDIIRMVCIVLMLCSIAVAAINIHHLLRYRKYSNGLIKMYDAMHTGLAEQQGMPLEADSRDHLIYRILNNEIDLPELTSIVESKQELKAELDALYGHVQINSHFLLNTLDSIYWTSVGNSSAESREATMIGDLCDILKYALDSSDLYTSLEEEVACAQKYLKIQQMRKNMEIKAVWDIPEELRNARVGKLILQPVIENSIQHGFQTGKQEECQLHIWADRQPDGMLLICIEDNGRGISPKEIQRMNKEMKKQQYLQNHHIGMANINRRLQVQFGGESGLSLKSLPDGGLSVCLRMVYAEYHSQNDFRQ